MIGAAYCNETERRKYLKASPSQFKDPILETSFYWNRVGKLMIMTFRISWLKKGRSLYSCDKENDDERTWEENTIQN